MILLRKLAFARAGKALVADASLQLHPGWKIGLTGANGCGKSSFFALLRGELHAEAGDLELPPGWKIGHVAQDTPALPDAALDFVLDGDAELRAVEAALAQAETAHDGHRIAELHARLDDIGGYAARARAAEILDGLGFSQDDHGRPVADFSGGWRVRLNLARALVSRSDLMLLDEPTNHLDLDAVLWLEGWLASYPGTLVMISHDRDFLDAVVNQILHIEGGGMRLYAGNYSAFERARAERLALQQAMHVKQQREVAHLHAYIDRFRAKASKARQAQSRIKALERMELISAAHVDAPFEFRFAEPEGFSDPLLALEDAAAGYPLAAEEAPRSGSVATASGIRDAELRSAGTASASTVASAQAGPLLRASASHGDAALLQHIKLTLRPGSRIGLLGSNGAGKSTLVKLLAGERPALAGRRIEGRHLKIGYFAQHQMELLRPDESPLQHLVRQEPATREQELRDYLGGFDFRGAMADAPCGHFSGGEKARLALALMIRTRPNLLLLDEPTNHLDLEMREALTLALQETEAAVVLVSHDRHLLRTTVDELWLVADGRVAPFDGDLDDYAAWLAAKRAQTQAGAPADAARTAQREQRHEDRAAKKAAQAERRKLEREAEKLDRELAALQAEKATLDAQLGDPALYAERERAAAVAQRGEQLAAAIEATEMRWLEVHEALEVLEAAAAVE